MSHGKFFFTETRGTIYYSDHELWTLYSDPVTADFICQDVREFL